MNDEPRNSDGSVARWWRQFQSAVRLNADDEELQLIADDAEHPHLEVLVAAAKHVHDVLLYKWEPDQRILQLQSALERGWGACGDATAAVVAVSLMRDVPVDVCYEETTLRSDRSPGTEHGYAHVRVAAGDVRVDAYPDKSLELPCARRFRVSRENVRWPAAAPVLPLRARRD